MVLLSPRYVQPEDGEPFVISPFVFLQIAPCHQQLCNRARWIPVNRLREIMFKNPQFVPFRINSKAVCPSLLLALEDEADSAPERIWGLTLESLVECFNLVNFIYLKPKLWLALDFAFTGVIASKIDLCNYILCFLVVDPVLKALEAVIKGKQKNDKKNKTKNSKRNNCPSYFYLFDSLVRQVRFVSDPKPAFYYFLEQLATATPTRFIIVI